MDGAGQFLAGAALLLAFLQLSRRGVRVIILLAAAQAGLLALAAMAAGHWWVALLVLVAKAVILPAALWRAAPAAETDAGIGVIASLLAGGALLALAIAVALPIAPGGLALSRQELALALAVLLLGLLMTATRRHKLAQAAGLMGAENAVLLAAIAADLPGLPAVAAGGLAVVAAIILGLLVLWRDALGRGTPPPEVAGMIHLFTAAEHPPRPAQEAP